MADTTETLNKIILPDQYKVVDNNFMYHPPKSGQQEKYVQIRDQCKEVAKLIISLCPNSRERSLAITKLEEAVMWANASIARNE